MSLIKCSECGKEFSDKAEVCPNCACPIEKMKTDKTPKQEKIENHKSDNKVDKVNKEESNKNNELKKDNKETNNNQTLLASFIILFFPMLIVLAMVESIRIPLIIVTIIIAFIVYLCSIFIENDKTKKTLNYIFYLCLGFAVLGIIMYAITPNEKIVNNTGYEERKEENKQEEKEENKTEIEEKEQKEDLEENQEEPKDEEEKTEEKTETGTEKEEDKLITMPKSSEEYVGTDYIEVMDQLVKLGFDDATTRYKETTDKKNEEDTLASITINGKSFKKGDTFDPYAKIVIEYWIQKEETKQEIVFPKEGSKLAKDYDTDNSYAKKRIYINVDNVKNIPKLQSYEGTYIVDGVYEYITYLKELGYKVEITDKEIKQPYQGFHTYDTYFKVSKGDFYWTMFLGIQDEDYIEYEFDIDLK